MSSQTKEIREYIFQILLESKANGNSYHDVRAGDILKAMHLRKHLCKCM